MFFNKVLRFKLNSGRVLEGEIIIADKTGNICLENCFEILETRLKFLCVNKNCMACFEGRKWWGMVWFRVSEIAEVYLKE